ncbi:MAG: DUF1837 domain-containing protein [Alteraurantiacibacter sp.]
MALYWDWCECAEDVAGRKRLWLLTEKAGGREAIWALLLEAVRDHYDDLGRVAADAARLGYEKAAEILRTRMPTDIKARSGDLGEILASELAEQNLGFRIPVKRLRFKDGRNMALRGDDFIGVVVGDDGQLRLLKGESKSRQQLAKTAITEAREALDRDDGRCTPESLLFVADRLLESPDADDQALGRALRDEVGQKALPPGRIDHMLFTLSGNSPPPSLKADLDASAADRNQYSTNLRIADHDDFIGSVYIEAVKLGND